MNHKSNVDVGESQIFMEKKHFIKKHIKILLNPKNGDKQKPKTKNINIHSKNDQLKKQKVHIKITKLMFSLRLDESFSDDERGI